MGTRNNTAIKFIAISSAEALAYQGRMPDENGQKPEVHISDGQGNPCRHCLKYVAKDDEVLLLSYRPFKTQQPFAEAGPIFLHASACDRAEENSEVPEVLQNRDAILIRGYDASERIIYGTGQIVSSETLKEKAQLLLDRSDVAYIHARSATNNCYSCRIERG
ncbi:DUF1203 domain-containing protein [Kiloniella laminariae]|uniref:DUF1203 domain-containing protein n=1 Tax=Kiloniella laminariae TaxID=454162 RepID=UPI000371315A|nr:DUF1203 domain-containing protein [Kiloniella laminariae]